MNLPQYRNPDCCLQNKPTFLTLALMVVVILLAGCELRPRSASSGEGAAHTSPEARVLDSHIAELEAQIAKLEKNLGKGRGAFRDGSLLRVEGKEKGEPPLDRLRRLERELADAQAQLSARDARVAELAKVLAKERDQGKALGEQASDLAYSRDALVTAQQALVEARAETDGMRAQLAASELQRLKAEREQYRFAAKMLRLVPGQTTQLLEIQEEARESARTLEAHVPTGSTHRPTNSTPSESH
ncbi:MAG: hypothetical protein AAB263_04225 [Planctomycetota bacterium]